MRLEENESNNDDEARRQNNTTNASRSALWGNVRRVGITSLNNLYTHVGNKVLHKFGLVREELKNAVCIRADGDCDAPPHVTHHRMFGRIFLEGAYRFLEDTQFQLHFPYWTSIIYFKKCYNILNKKKKETTYFWLKYFQRDFIRSHKRFAVLGGFWAFYENVTNYIFY